MDRESKNTLRQPSIIDRMREQELTTAECVLILENIVAKITGQHLTPTPTNGSLEAVEVRSLYGKLADHEEFLRTIISRLTAATNALDVGL